MVTVLASCVSDCENFTRVAPPCSWTVCIQVLVAIERLLGTNLSIATTCHRVDPELADRLNFDTLCTQLRRILCELDDLNSVWLKVRKSNQGELHVYKGEPLEMQCMLLMRCMEAGPGDMLKGMEGCMWFCKAHEMAHNQALQMMIVLSGPGFSF